MRRWAATAAAAWLLWFIGPNFVGWIVVAMAAGWGARGRGEGIA